MLNIIIFRVYLIFKVILKCQYFFKLLTVILINQRNIGTKVFIQSTRSKLTGSDSSFHFNIKIKSSHF